uniref:Uncharacterized protein n=1 Tax=Rangifer tarandus platyrhynchus TaxID=3082113 RepID=A0ACB0FIK7_RANTA|nr:unnamed protein product [Rangifer tarandus platyrhynchus]
MGRGHIPLTPDLDHSAQVGAHSGGSLFRGAPVPVRDPRMRRARDLPEAAPSGGPEALRTGPRDGAPRCSAHLRSLTAARGLLSLRSFLSRSARGLPSSARWLPSPPPGRLRRLSHEGGRSGQARRQDLGTAPHTSL